MRVAKKETLSEDALKDLCSWWLTKGVEYLAHEGDADYKMSVCAECEHEYLLWQLVDDLCEDCHKQDPYYYHKRWRNVSTG